MHRLLALAALGFGASAHALDIPVDEATAWTALEFNGIPANAVSTAEGALCIAVDGSASPLVHKLEAPIRISGVSVVAHWSGSLSITNGANQGDTDSDDFVLKLGVVESGDRTLGWFQRRIAADWIKQLFRLAPEGAGIERINFLSTTQQRSLLGSRRVHPLSDLLHEERVVHLEAPGRFEINHRFDTPVEVLGLWISSDGDNTDSTFDLCINQITLHTD